jgi:ataxin-3
VTTDTVFCVPALSHLCPPCTSKAQRQRGLPEYWWKEDDLVKGKGQSSVTAATDPWRDVGSGMRLDGKPTVLDPRQIDGLTEEEMMQMALAASLEPENAATMDRIALTPEPAAGTPETARVQFRLPNGGRSVRRFLNSDPIGMIYAFVESEVTGGQGKQLELRYGFPPKDLLSVRGKTIGEASLNGEAIQCRFV